MESFVVHVWLPGDDDRRTVDTTQLRGVVRHVATGTEARFSEDSGLLALLHAAIATGAELTHCTRNEPEAGWKPMADAPLTTEEGTRPIVR